MNSWDLIIVGGGPAGLTAGLYACRAGLKTMLTERMFTGGQIVTTELLENYPGFPAGISGVDIGLAMMEQATKFGLTVQYEGVESLELAGPEKRVTTTGGVYTARTVILCMGAQPRTLGLPREEALRGKGVSYCATCDGAFFRDRDVAVVGGGDTACEDALYLSRVARSVTLIHRRDTLRGSAILQQRIGQRENIALLLESQVTELLGEDALRAVKVQTPQGSRELSVSGLFVAVGTTPMTALVRDQLACDEAGYIRTDRACRTSLEGVWAAGDIRDTVLRQVVTAAADGAIAATEAQRYLMG